MNELAPQQKLNRVRNNKSPENKTCVTYSSPPSGVVVVVWNLREGEGSRADDSSGATGNRTSLQCDPVDEIFARSKRDSEKNIVVALLLLLRFTSQYLPNGMGKGVESLFVDGEEKSKRSHTH